MGINNIKIKLKSEKGLVWAKIYKNVKIIVKNKKLKCNFKTQFGK